MTSISSLKEKRQAKRRARLEDRVKKYTKRGTSVNKRGATRAAAGESREQQDKKSAKHFLKAHTAKEKLAKMDKRRDKKVDRVKKKIDKGTGGTNYAGGSKTFNESTGRHERPDGTPMKRKNKRMGRQTPKGPSPTPYRGAAPKNSGTMKPGPRPSPIGGGSGGNGTYKKPTPSASKPAPKRSAPKKAAPKRSAPKRSAPKARPAARKAARKSNRRSKK